MDIRIATYDADTMQPGKFYIMQVNKDNATALVEVPTSGKFNIVNSKYIEIKYTNEIPLIQVWEEVYNEGGVLKCNVIDCFISLREDINGKFVSCELNRSVNGFVILK